MKNSYELRLGIILKYVSVGIGVLSSLIYTPIMLNLLGQSEYGLYNISASVISYLGILNLGFGSSYIKFYSNYKEKKENNKIKSLNASYVLLFTSISVLTIIAGFILANNSNIILGNNYNQQDYINSSRVMIIQTISLSVSFFSIPFLSYIRSNEKFIIQELLSILRYLTSPLISFPLLLLDFLSPGLALGVSISNILMNIGYILYAIKKINMTFDFRNIKFNIFKEIFIFSSFIFVQILIDQVNWNVDKLIIGRISGSNEVAIYSISALINAYYLTLLTAVSSVFVPKIHRYQNQENNNKKINLLFKNVGRIQFLILSLLITGFILFGEYFINFWAGPKYEESYIITLILIIGISIDVIQNIGIEITRAKNKHKFRAYLYLSVAVINIILTIFLVKIYGARGAAIGTAASVLLGNGLIMNIYYHKVIKLDIKGFWKLIIKMFPPTVFSLLLGFLFTRIFIINSIWSMLLGIIIYSFIYFINYYIFSSNLKEKKYISSLISKILKK